jgi:dynactin complex subunit
LVRSTRKKVFINLISGKFCGIEFEEEGVALNDGSFNGKYYFQTKPLTGMFIEFEKFKYYFYIKKN